MVLPVATAVVRVGVLLSGMTSGSVLEAGTRFPPTMASADTVYVAPGMSPLTGQLMVGHDLVTQGPVAGALGHSLTSYELTGPPVVGGLSRMLAVVGEVGSAAAMIGDLQ